MLPTLRWFNLVALVNWAALLEDMLLGHSTGTMCSRIPSPASQYTIPA
jgi:hypothetical protein